MKDTRFFSRLFSILCVAILFTGVFGTTVYGNPEEKVIRIACGSNKLFYQEGEEMQGICADYLEKLAEINHWKYEYVDATWTESIRLLATGEIDMLFPVQSTIEGKENMSFSDLRGGYQQIALLAADKSEIYYEDFKGFEGKRIAVTKGSYNEEALKDYAKNHNFQYTTVYLNSTQERLDALAKGEVDLVVYSALTDTKDCKTVGIIEIQPFFYAVSKGNKSLLTQLNEGMQKILIDNPELVQELEEDCAGSSNQYPALTKEENEYMEKKKKVVVGFYNHIEPLAHNCSNEGELEGVFDNLLEEMEELSGMEFEPYLIEDGVYGPDLIEDGTVDFLMGQVKEGTDAEAMGFLSTSPLMSGDIVLISRSKFQISRDSKIILGLTKGRDYWQDIVRDVLADVEVQFYDTSKDCLMAVKDGLVDATVLNTMEFNYQSKNEQFKDLIEWGNYRLATDIILMASPDADPLMISVVNKIIEKIPQEDVLDIVNYHMNLPYHSEDFWDRMYAMQEGLSIASVVAVCSIALLLVVILIRRQTFQTLEEKNIELQKANQVKLNFLSNMSHEMRTPINVILGLTDMVMDAPDMESATDDLKKIKGAGRLLLTQINDVLDITKIEQTKITLKPEPYFCKDFEEQITSLIGPLAKKKNQNLTMDFTKAEKAWLYVDKVRFNQIFFNLLSNAVKYTPIGGDITFTAETMERTEETVKHRFVVQDTGIGMSEKFLAHVGEPFAREDNETTKTTEGSGLGIYIVKQLIYSMKGKMAVESTLGRGTTFIVELETRNRDHFPEKVEDQKKKLNLVREEKTFTGYRALICEDHPINAKIASGLLQKVGMEVDVASNGEAGFQKMRCSEEGFYDVIFMDIRMPVMDGLEATRLIREEEREDCKSIPIIAMTANAFVEDKEKSRSAGMNDHLVKPIEVEELYKILKLYLKEK